MDPTEKLEDVQIEDTEHVQGEAMPAVLDEEEGQMNLQAYLALAV